MLSLDQVTPASFLSVLNEPFEIVTGTGGISVRLTRVETRPSGPGSRAEPFTMVFTGAPQLRLPQSIYRLQNVTLGPMEIFLVQVGADAAGSYFEAIFN
jgi:hypothetical protein